MIVDVVFLDLDQRPILPSGRPIPVTFPYEPMPGDRFHTHNIEGPDLQEALWTTGTSTFKILCRYIPVGPSNENILVFAVPFLNIH